MASFVEALRAVNSMKEQSVIEDYAIAGAMALVFWTEPVATYDLDVLVFLPGGPGRSSLWSGYTRGRARTAFRRRTSTS